MSKNDFKGNLEQLNDIGIVQVCRDFYCKPNDRLFVKSPVTTDKNWSLKLYPTSNRFCDFANGNKSGDIIGLYGYINGVNNWQALKQLQALYGLNDDRQQDAEERRRKIRRQQEQERKKAARKQTFHKAVFAEIDDLKQLSEKYKAVLENSEIKPFSDIWTYCLDEIQRIEYRLDVLTASDQSAYRRMKPNSDSGLSSDHPQWLLDCLSILAECGRFEAAANEMAEITAQRDFELCRMPRRDRRCGVEW